MVFFYMNDMFCFSYTVIYTVTVNLCVFYLNTLLEELKVACIFRLVVKHEKNDDALSIDKSIHIVFLKSKGHKKF